VIAVDPAELDPVVETFDNLKTQCGDFEWLRGGGAELDEGRRKLRLWDSLRQWVMIQF
jgi:hypothetical protein